MVLNKSFVLCLVKLAYDLTKSISNWYQRVLKKKYGYLYSISKKGIGASLINSPHYMAIVLDLWKWSSTLIWSFSWNSKKSKNPFPLWTFAVLKHAAPAPAVYQLKLFLWPGSHYKPCKALSFAAQKIIGQCRLKTHHSWLIIYCTGDGWSLWRCPTPKTWWLHCHSLVWINTKWMLSTCKRCLLGHPPYSANLVPWDFFLFLRVRVLLKITQFEKLEQEKEKSATLLRNTNFTNFQNCFLKIEKMKVTLYRKDREVHWRRT